MMQIRAIPVLTALILLLVLVPGIQAADTYGFVAKWGSAGTGDGQFQMPVGIATDAGGNVYVADAQNNRVQKFTSTGTFVSKWGSAGTGNGNFYLPFGVATDHERQCVHQRQQQPPDPEVHLNRDLCHEMGVLWVCQRVAELSLGRCG